MSCPTSCLLSALADSGCATNIDVSVKTLSVTPDVASQLQDLMSKCCKNNPHLSFPPVLSSCAAQSGCQQALPSGFCNNILATGSSPASTLSKQNTVSLNPFTPTLSITEIIAPSRTPSIPTKTSSVPSSDPPSATSMAPSATLTDPSPNDPEAASGLSSVTPAGSVSTIKSIHSNALSNSSVQSFTTTPTSTQARITSTGIARPSDENGRTSVPRHTNIGNITGGVIGGVVCVILLFAGIWYARRRTSRRTNIAIRTSVQPFLGSTESKGYTPTSPDPLLHPRSADTPVSISPFLLITSSTPSPHDDALARKQRPPSPPSDTSPVFRRPSSDASSSTEARLMSSVASLRRHLDAIRRDPSQALSSVISRASSRRSLARSNSAGNSRPPTETTRAIQQEMAALRAQMQQLQAEQRSSANARFTMEGMLRTMALMQAEIDDLRIGHEGDAETLPGYVP